MIGHWKNGKVNGPGTEFLGSSSKFSGDKYIGEFKYGVFEGQGTYFDSSEDSKHVGQFKNGIPNGYGITEFGSHAKYPNCRYEGNYKNGVFDGFGKLSFGDIGPYAKDKYVGYFLKGKFDGQGRYSWVNSGYYQGSFKNNVQDGNGSFVFNDGSIFNGIWTNGYNSEFSKILKSHNRNSKLD
jgi:hypothetical protein